MKSKNQIPFLYYVLTVIMLVIIYHIFNFKDPWVFVAIIVVVAIFTLIALNVIAGIEEDVSNTEIWREKAKIDVAKSDADKARYEASKEAEKTSQLKYQIQLEEHKEATLKLELELQKQDQIKPTNQ